MRVSEALPPCNSGLPASNSAASDSSGVLPWTWGKRAEFEKGGISKVLWLDSPGSIDGNTVMCFFSQFSS